MAPRPVAPDAPNAINPGQARARREARRSGRLDVPADRFDPAAWDRYWTTHLEVGPTESAFSDMMASDPKLLETLTRRATTTILCVGGGLSVEPIVLALHGFDVTMLDISQVPRNVFLWITASAEHPLCSIPGVMLAERGVVVFTGVGPIDPDACPPMHRSDRYLPKRGGTLRYVVGDVRNRELCVGPYDAVIERRTIQLFDASRRVEALECVESRLSERGLFVSHEHRGSWKPGQALTHYASKWTRSHGFVTDQEDPSRRTAFLRLTTG